MHLHVEWKDHAVVHSGAATTWIHGTGRHKQLQNNSRSLSTLATIASYGPQSAQFETFTLIFSNLIHNYGTKSDTAAEKMHNLTQNLTGTI